MELTTLLSTTAGKAAAGLAIAGVSLGGLSAAGAELPLIAGEGVEVDEPPVEAETIVAQTPAGELGDDEGDDAATEAGDTDELEVEEARLDDEPATTDEHDGVVSRSDGDNELPGVEGQSVAETARQDGGVDGAEVSEAARAGTPAEDRAPERAGDDETSDNEQAVTADDEGDDDDEGDEGDEADDAGAEHADGAPEKPGRP